MKITLSLLALALGFPVYADDADVAAAIASANMRFRQRQTEQPSRQKVVGKPSPKQPVSPAKAATPLHKDPAPLTYAEAYRKALASKKPLLVWCGGNFCPRCVNDSRDEFVHCFVDSFPSAVTPSIAVCVPEDGKLMRLTGDVTSWITGDKEFGHLPTVRKRIRSYLDRAKGVTRIVPSSGQWSESPMQVVPSRGRAMRGWSVSGSC